MSRFFVALGLVLFLSCSTGQDNRERQVFRVNSSSEGSSLADTLAVLPEITRDMKMKINGAWTAVDISGVSVQVQGSDLPVPTLEIHVNEMRYAGNDGCNNYQGGITELDEGIIRFGVSAATRMMCVDMTVPDLFNASIPQVAGWQITDDFLCLNDAEGRLLMRFRH